MSPRRRAFLIGNQTFRPDAGLEALRGPVHDVLALGRVLRDPTMGAFEVREYADKSRDGILPDIDEALGDASQGDMILLYYAGHGRLDRNGRLCLATSDTRATSVYSTSIPAKNLCDLIRSSMCETILLLLDCCYSGLVGGDLRGDVNSEFAMLREVRGLHALTASSANETAREVEDLDGGVVMGHFTAAIVRGIETGAADYDQNGVITVSDLTRFLKDAVRGQTPQYWADEASGDPVIAWFRKTMRRREPKSRPPREVAPDVLARRRVARLAGWFREEKIQKEDFKFFSYAALGEAPAHTVTLVRSILDLPRATPAMLYAVWERLDTGSAPAEDPFAAGPAELAKPAPSVLFQPVGPAPKTSGTGGLPADFDPLADIIPTTEQASVPYLPDDFDPLAEVPPTSPAPVEFQSPLGSSAALVPDPFDVLDAVDSSEFTFIRRIRPAAPAVNDLPLARAPLLDTAMPQSAPVGHGFWHHVGRLLFGSEPGGKTAPMPAETPAERTIIARASPPIIGQAASSTPNNQRIDAANTTRPAIQTLGKYGIRRLLGRGSMGSVYEGFDPIIARVVAIKTVRLPDVADAETAEGVSQFRREAQAAGRLNHPNVVGVFDYGETDELAYIVMEFVDGPTLKMLTDRDEKFSVSSIAGIMRDVLSGLQYSHERGVVHRDIKPANVMLTASGQAKITDFGIARIESSSMTQAGTVLGTPAYMSPEQFMGETVDARTDIYSAGILLYQLLTGGRPFDGSMSAIMHKTLNTDPPLPSRMSLTAPRALDAVVMRAIAKRREERFASASEFAEAIQAAITQ